MKKPSPSLQDQSPQDACIHNTILRAKGYRLTPQRALILHLLQETGDHLTIDQLVELVQHRFPSISQSTVYRTLDLLKELELVKETLFPDHQLKYEVTNRKIHHHLVCKYCKRVLHLEGDLEEELHAAVQKNYQYYEVTMNVMSVGCCRMCWEKQHPREHEFIDSHKIT